MVQVCHTCADRERLQSHMNDGDRQFGATAVMIPFDLGRDVDEEADLAHLKKVQNKAWRDPDDLPAY